jgi:imidazolonepropionase-like amidohydrolase
MAAYGVTNVRDLGGRFQDVQAWRAAMAEGRLTGPSIKAAGPNVESERWLTGATKLLESQADLKHYKPFEASPRLSIAGPEQARTAVDELAAMGVDVVKFRNLGGDSFRAFSTRARERKLPIAGHSASGLTLAEAAEAGQGSIEHGETVSNRLEKATPEERTAEFRRVARAGAMITPTLIADYVRTQSEAAQLRAIEQPGPLVSASLLTLWRFGYDTRRFNGDKDWTSFFQRSAEDLRAAHAAGVPMMVGTDLGVLTIRPGISVHEEMALMVDRLGMSPAQVLQAASVNPGRFFGETSAGSIAPGARADLVLLDANPLTNISATQRIRGVTLRGRHLDRAALDRLVADATRAMAERRECAG